VILDGLFRVGRLVVIPKVSEKRLKNRPFAEEEKNRKTRHGACVSSAGSFQPAQRFLCFPRCGLHFSRKLFSPSSSQRVFLVFSGLSPLGSSRFGNLVMVRKDQLRKVPVGSPSAPEDQCRPSGSAGNRKRFRIARKHGG